MHTEYAALVVVDLGAGTTICRSIDVVFIVAFIAGRSKAVAYTSNEFNGKQNNSGVVAGTLLIAKDLLTIALSLFCAVNIGCSDINTPNSTPKSITKTDLAKKSIPAKNN